MIGILVEYVFEGRLEENEEKKEVILSVVKRLSQTVLESSSLKWIGTQK